MMILSFDDDTTYLITSDLARSARQMSIIFYLHQYVNLWNIHGEIFSCEFNLRITEYLFDRNNYSRSLSADSRRQNAAPQNDLW